MRIRDAPMRADELVEGQAGRWVAALFVDAAGVYSKITGVDTWGPERDARTYDGPHPVVAHPPCARWCRFAGLVEARWGHRKGEDDGCFEAALASVRRWGGVLEHPAYSDAWAAFGLAAPPSGEGWHAAGFCGGWCCYVEQHRYGHPARKATWLYAHSVDLPMMRWGQQLTGQWDWRARKPKAWVGWTKNNGNPDGVIRVGKKAAAATPPAFAKVLIGIARTARR